MSQVDTFLEHFSDAPWSDFKQSDYSVEQWHAACLIHDHTGDPTSKSQCKLPCKTPDGVTNKNAVYAAAAALAGARGGVNASPEQKASAAKVLEKYYKDMNKDVPPSLMSMLHSTETEVFLAHFGIRGMRWGVRNRRSSVSKQQNRKISQDYRKTRQLKKRSPASLSNKQLETVNKRLNLEQKYRKLNPNKVDKGREFAKIILPALGVTATITGVVESAFGKKMISGAKSFLQNRATRRAAERAFRSTQQKTLF